MVTPDEVTQNLMAKINDLMRIQLQALGDQMPDDRLAAERKMFDLHKEILREIYALAKRAG